MLFLCMFTEKLDIALAQYDGAEDLLSDAQMNALAVKRGLDPNNKTASIRSRHSAQRLTAVEIEDIMIRQGSQDDSVQIPPPVENKPVVKTFISMNKLKAKGSSTLPKNLNRAQSTPNLAQNEMTLHPGPASPQSVETYARHITRVDIGDKSPVQTPKSHYVRSVSASSNQPNGHYARAHVSRNVTNGTNNEHLYAVPSKGPRRYGSVEHLLSMQQVIPPPPREVAPTPPQRGVLVPPPPDHPPPIPPHERNYPGEVVKITKSPTYANVSQHIAEQQITRQQNSPYESSFRPGMNARLNKEVNLPDNLGPPKLTHSRTNSSISSGSDHSDTRPTVRGMAERFEQGSGDVTSQGKGSVSFAEDKVFENAARFMQDHPDATLLVTADIHSDKSTPKQQTYYEPEPDYDSVPAHSGVEVHSPSVSSVRNTWAVRDAQNQPTATRSPRPSVSRDSYKEEESMSEFSSAIKLAAIKRERKREESPQPSSPPRGRPSMQRQSSSGSVHRPRQAPPPPPPPPIEPPKNPSPLIIRKTPVPEHLRKQRAEERKVDESHVALMAAIAKRRNIVENSDREKLAEDLDSKISKTKKIQSPVIHKSEKSKVEFNKAELVKHNEPEKPVVPFGPGMLRPSGSPRTVPRSEVSKVESKPVMPVAPKVESKPVKPVVKEEVKVVIKPATPVVMSNTTRQSQPITPAPVMPPTPTTPATPTTPVGEESLTAKAERARQQYLQKKADMMDRRKASPSPHAYSPIPPPPSTAAPQPPTKDEEKENKSKLPDNCSPRPSNNVTKNDNSHDGDHHGVANFASIIAQRATARQKSIERTVDNNGNQTGKQASYSTVYKGQKTNGIPNGGTKLSDGDANSDALQKRLGGNERVQIKGATMDASHTETLPNTPVHKVTSPNEPENKSVAAKMKMFESSLTFTPKVSSRSSHTTPDLPFDLPPPMFDSNGQGDAPPPMVPPPPPPDFEYNSRPTDLDIINGHNSRGPETIGWVINSSPSKSAHEYAIRNKLAHHNGGLMEMHYSGSGDVAQVALVSPPQIDCLVEVEHELHVEFIPPPPIFDSEDTDILSSLPPGMDSGMTTVVQEDNASMVSSLSTLSTLSSNEHDCYHHDSSGYSSGRNRYTSSQQSTTGSQSDEAYSDMAPPPPPGFDDLGGEPHYEELDPVQEFIPPPMGFDIPPPMEFSTAPTSADAQVTSLRHAMRSHRDFEIKPMTSWTQEDVSDWLDSLQLGQHRLTFMRNNVNGYMLSKMGRNELIALGVLQVGDRMSLERAIKRAQLNR